MSVCLARFALYVVSLAGLGFMLMLYVCLSSRVHVNVVQSNLSYPGALGLGGARNSELSVSQNTI